MKIKNICLVSFLALKFLSAQELVDCRVIISGVTECNPYAQRLHHLQFIHNNKGEESLDIVKKDLTLKEDNPLYVISSEEILENYVKTSSALAIEEKTSLTPFIKREVHENTLVCNETIIHGAYKVSAGDVLSKIAKKFEVSLATLVTLNALKNTSSIRVGQTLTIPLEEEMVDNLASGTYTVKKGDTLIGIAKQFNFTAKDLVVFNHIIDTTSIRVGKVLKLPLPYIVKAIKKAEKKARKNGYKPNLDMRSFGKHQLRVTATAYTSHKNQTDSTPFIAAWNNRIRPGMKLIAISRDLLRYSGIRNGTKVRISGLPGIYKVKDKMNKRYRKRIDIYMGMNLKKALKWGRRSVVIYW